ncbi:unnamed protein product [Linum tenue]|uniref:Carboxypeptidase n=1 Tax=Linum tenue TaxID=586396 RepID=A0AAV0JSB5_9ROSI|nr:unnamed protein product [Linum tenue]
MVLFIDLYSSVSTVIISSISSRRSKPHFLTFNHSYNSPKDRKDSSTIMGYQLWLIMCVILASFIANCRTVESAYDADKIMKLPGQPEVSFQQYAGYVTVDEIHQRKLFYYFVEAATNSSSKPLVLWLNGGPGCSSIGGGAFAEHGPFKPNAAGVLVNNVYSWNKANDNMAFLQQWLVKFPEYKSSDLFITGESYAGHYVPQLAQLIVESGSNLNLKAIAIGNPLLEFNTDFNEEGEYYWSHGLISDQTYDLLNTVCNFSQLIRESLSGNVSKPCQFVISQLVAELPNQNFDSYDVTSDVCLSDSGSQLGPQKQYSFLASIYHPFLPLKSNQSPPIKQEAGGESTDLCVQEWTYTYLNRKDVQEAMHAKLVGILRWIDCTDVLNYDHNSFEIPTIEVLGSLVKSGIRVLVYSGDQDSVVPFIGTRILVNRLATETGLNTTVPYKAWFDFDKQVGGWTQVYGGNNKLSFATIRGASHMAPFSSPKRSLALFAAFVAGRPLAA